MPVTTVLQSYHRLLWRLKHFGLLDFENDALEYYFLEQEAILTCGASKTWHTLRWDICHCKHCLTVCYKLKMRLHKTLGHPQSIPNFKWPCSLIPGIFSFPVVRVILLEEDSSGKMICLLTTYLDSGDNSNQKYLISATLTGHLWNSFPTNLWIRWPFLKVGWSNESKWNHRTIESHGLRMASHFDLTLRATQKHLRFLNGGWQKCWK